eukprot:SAG11_NODE_16807_length_537_cov_0.803653_1_plen_22_part_01
MEFCQLHRVWHKACWPVRLHRF